MMSKGMKNRFAPRLLLLLLLFAFLGLNPTGQSQAEPFYFVQMTDLHWGEEDLDQTAAVVEAVNELPMDIACVLVSGDITSDRVQDEELMRKGLTILSRLRMPVLFAPGNHDILRRRLPETRQAFEELFGPLAARREFSDVVFLSLFTEPLATGFTMAGYDPLRELERLLAKPGDKPVIVFHHTPSVQDFYNNRMHPGWPERKRTAWSDILNEHNVAAVLAGHFHRDEFHFIGDVPLYVCPPVARRWGRQTAFRLYSLENGRLSYRTQYLE